jgi:hypothetical protein
MSDFGDNLIKARAERQDAEQQEAAGYAEWSDPETAEHWSRVYRCTAKTFRKRVQTREIIAELVEGGYKVLLSDGSGWTDYHTAPYWAEHWGIDPKTWVKRVNVGTIKAQKYPTGRKWRVWRADVPGKNRDAVR